MAQLRGSDGRRLYLDANVFVYIVEGFEMYKEALGALLRDMDEGRVVAITSELTLAEVLVKPIQTGRADLVRAYETMISPGRGREIMPVSRDILREAARLRASTSLRLPDAIHVATAKLSNCHSVITNDAGIRDSGGLPTFAPGSIPAD
jgi:predicted nucleic acid-binding protein